MSLKNITPQTFDTYRKNIQLQFNDDTNFIDFMQSICNYGIEYQQTLINFNYLMNFFKQDTYPPLNFVNPQNKFILNSIGSLLNLPPIDYFYDYFEKDTSGNIESYNLYTLLIRGQMAKNLYNGTNSSTPYLTDDSTGQSLIQRFNLTSNGMGLLEVLKFVYKESYKFFITDNGDMSLQIDILPLNPMTTGEQQLWLEGWLIPKPAGVNISLQILSGDDSYFAWDIPYQQGPPKLTSTWNTGVWYPVTVEQNLL